MVFNRQLYKQKPSAWGPASNVQASIFKNAERIGIDPALTAIYIPFWERAGLHINNYGIYSGNGTAVPGVTWKNNALETIAYTGSSNIITMSRPTENIISLTTPFTLYFRAFVSDFIGWDYPGIVKIKCSDGQEFRAGFGNIVNYQGVICGSSANWVTIETNESGFAGAWHNVFIIYNGRGSGDIANFKIIRNNIQRSTSTAGAFGGNIDETSIVPSNGVNQNFNGLIDHVWFLKTALNDSQVSHLSDNPYFLLHRVAPIFYSVPGGGAITIKTVTDTGSGLDGIAQISNILSVSDSGSGLDVFAGLVAGISVVDVGSGTDAVQPAASVTVQDTGVAIDLIQQISAACSVADTGTGDDNIGRLLASLFVSDTGTGSDIITVLKELLKTVTDSGAGTDSVSQLLATVSVGDTGSCTDTISQILADISVSDTGAGADFINLLKDILKTISDTGTGTDFVSIQPVSVSVYDAGIALDLIGHIAVALSVSDAGTVAEIISTIKTKLVTVTDTGTGSDSAPTISVSLTVSDVSAALDVVGQVLNSLTVSDTGSGLDRIKKTDFNILPNGKVTVTFTIKTPGASFAMRTPKATFNIE